MKNCAQLVIPSNSWGKNLAGICAVVALGMETHARHLALILTKRNYCFDQKD